MTSGNHIRFSMSEETSAELLNTSLSYALGGWKSVDSVCKSEKAEVELAEVMMDVKA